MRLSRIVVLALLSLGLTVPASAELIIQRDGNWESRIDPWFTSSYVRGSETVEPRGGRVLTGKIGPWFLSNYTFEDGARACMGFNLVQRRQQPQFSFVRVVRGDDVREFVSFYARSPGDASKEATLRIGDEAFDLVSLPNDDPQVARSVGASVAQEVAAALASREMSRQKFFEVTDTTGRVYRFDARDTSRMQERIRRFCS